MFDYELHDIGQCPPDCTLCAEDTINLPDWPQPSTCYHDALARVTIGTVCTCGATLAQIAPSVMRWV